MRSTTVQLLVNSLMIREKDRRARSSPKMAKKGRAVSVRGVKCSNARPDSNLIDTFAKNVSHRGQILTAPVEALGFLSESHMRGAGSTHEGAMLFDAIYRAANFG